MKQPNEFWLKYLLVCSNLSLAKVMSLARMYGLTPPTREYLQYLKREVEKTKPKPFKTESVKVKNWIRRQRIMSMANKNPEAIQARGYLGNTKVRPILEALILADTERKKIPDYCKALAGVRPTLKSVKLFEHYFWNRDLLTLGDWEDYLKLNRNKKFLINCRERGPEFALWRLGYREELSVEDVVKGVLHEATMRYFETSSRPNNRDTAITAKLWSETIFRSLEEMDKTGDALQQVIDELKDVAIKLEKAPIVDIETLTNGNHSKPD